MVHPDPAAMLPVSLQTRAPALLESLTVPFTPCSRLSTSNSNVGGLATVTSCHEKCQATEHDTRRVSNRPIFFLESAGLVGSRRFRLRAARIDRMAQHRLY